jgi:hypothetical protein
MQATTPFTILPRVKSTYDGVMLICSVRWFTKEHTRWIMLTAFREQCLDLNFARMRFNGSSKCLRLGHPGIRRCNLFESESSATTTAPVFIKFTYGHGRKLKEHNYDNNGLYYGN